MNVNGNRAAARPALLSVLLAAVALCGVAVPAAATIIRDPPWADFFGGRWNDLDTHASASSFGANFTTQYTLWVDQDRDAATSLSSAYAGSDAVWVAFGHGVGGGMVFCNLL